MKTKLLLLLSVCIGMTSSAWALEKEGDIYQIGTAQDLADFAALVNGGETAVDAVLTQDIDMSELDFWTAIGDWNTGAVTSAYCGHFDGQGYKITGFNFTSTHNYYGLFGVVSTGCFIENFTIEGSITVNQNYGYVGGVVSYARDKTPTIRNVHSAVNISSTSTASTPRIGGILGGVPAQNSYCVIDRCTYSGTLDGNDKGGNYGGIVGYINNNANVSTDITNCLFEGKLKGNVNENKAQYGGIIGYTRKGIVSVKNCLSIGTFEYEDGNAMNIGQFIGRLTFDNGTSGCTFTDNYYKDMGYELYGTSSGGAPKGSAPTAVTTEQLASGEVAYALNDEKSDEVSWFQKLGTDEYPTPYGTDIVYPAGRQHCDGTAYEGVTGFSNAASVQDDHDFVDGYCSYCGAIDADYMTANTDGNFEIGTPNQLKWFADYVNQIAPAANAVLTADIDLDGIAWTPIGNVSNKYSGTFDGQNYSITNFNYTATGDYNGLFGYINNAIVKNFSIRGTLTSTFNKNGVVGAADGASVVSGIHSALTINVSDFKGHTGGIVGGDGGNVAHTLLVENCEYSGILTHSGLGDCQAGILGYAYAGGVRNCVFSGTIIGENSKYGGILGYCKIVTFLGVKNCLSIGKIVADENCTTAAAIIANWNGNATENVTNNYYCLAEGSTPTIAIGNKASSCEAPVQVTAEQLASGEVAYKLGDAWGQVLGTDEVPSPQNENAVNYVGDAGYATLYDATTGYELNGDVEANVAVLNTKWLDLTKIENVPAATPVVLKGTYYNKVAADLPALNIANDLKGTDMDTEAGGSIYILAKVDNNVGFYQATENTIIPAGKAILIMNAGVKAFFFNGESETGIASPLGETGEGVSIYNMAGQRISKLQKGVNIVSGRKVLY